MTNRQTLRESVRSLNPEALRIFKRQLQAMPAVERQRLFSQLSGIPELADITGTPSPLTTEQKRRDTPLWMKALNVIGAPFRLAEEKVIKPAVAVATGLYTPPTPGTQGMNWFQREQAEYKAWKAPWGVKGTLEFLPWLAVPSAGGVIGRLGGMATKQAGTSLGRGAALAQKVLQPVATAERIATYPIAKPLELGIKQITKAVRGMERLPGAATTELGLARGVGKVGAKAAGVAKPSGKWLYHGTPEGNLERIRKEGLTSKTRTRNDYGNRRGEYAEEAPLEELLYFDEKLTKAWGGKGAIQLRIDEEAIPSKVWVDKDVLRPGEIFASSRESFEIPPEAIQYLDKKSNRWRSIVVPPPAAPAEARAAQVKELSQKYPWMAEEYAKAATETEAEYVARHMKEARRAAKELGMPLSERQRGMLVKEYQRLFPSTPAEAIKPPIEAPGAGLKAEVVEGKISQLRKLNRKLNRVAEDENLTGLALETRIKQEIINKFGADFDVILFRGIKQGKVSDLWGHPYEEGIPGAHWSMSYERAKIYAGEKGKIFQIRAKGSDLANGELTTPRVQDDEFRLSEELQKRLAPKVVFPGVEAPGAIPKVIPLTTTPIGGTLLKKGIPPVEPPLGVAAGGVPPTKPPPGLSSVMFPEGFNTPLAVAVSTITQLIKKIKPIRAETGKLYSEARRKQMDAYEAALKEAIERGVPPREALEEAQKRLFVAGGLPKASLAGYTPVGGQVTEETVQTLFKAIQDAPYLSHFDRVNTAVALGRLLDPVSAGIPREFEFKLLEQTFGPDLVKELLKKRPWGTRAWELTMDIANAPRALLASMDISALLRQGGMLVARHPWEGAMSTKPMVKALWSDKNAILLDSITRGRAGMEKLTDKSLEIPLYLAPLPTQVSARLGEREEAFISQLLNKIGVVKASNRSFVVGINDLRARSALNVLNSWEKMGLKYTSQDISQLNRLVNWASGRGDLPGGLSKFGPLMSSFLFAPRLLVSRPQTLTMVLPWVNPSKLARVEAWKTLLAFAGAGSGILTMAALSGRGKVELDPRSPNFGKMHLVETDTYADIWTGYSQLLRFTAQLATAERKTVGGRIASTNRLEVVGRFLQSKESPALGLLTDLLKGETFLGEDIPPKSAGGALGQLWERVAPLAIQDMIDATRQGGLAAGLLSTAGLAGVGMTTFVDEAQKKREAVARKNFGMSWDEVGQRFGQATQLKLESATPEITKAEQEKEERFSGGPVTLMKQWRREGQSIEDTYREAVQRAAQEFRVTQDGSRFRDKVDEVAAYRRISYASRAKRKEYKDIADFYNQPLSPSYIASLNVADVIRREFYQTMFSADMYDQFGTYRFDEADRREQAFLVKHGQAALDYIEEYRGARWPDKPPELQALEQAREVLRPYWKTSDQVWAQMPPGLQAISDQIQIMERTDPQKARQALRGYPQIVWAREQIARLKKQLRLSNPTVNQAYAMFGIYR